MKKSYSWVCLIAPLLIARADAGYFEILTDPADHCTSEKRVAVCDDEGVKASVDWACRLLAEKGKGALTEIRIIRFNCCSEPNYVWLNDLKPAMVLHPIKAGLNGKDLSQAKDANGKFIFVEFTNAAKEKPDGAWVEYVWPKAGETVPSPKKSWVRLCGVAGLDEKWVVGSGTWLDTPAVPAPAPVPSVKR